MAIVLPTALRTTRANTILAALDAGSGAAKLVIRNAANATLVTIPLGDPAGTVSNGVLTFDVPHEALPVLAGTADNALLTDSDDNLVMSGLTVGTSGANVNMATLDIQLGVPQRVIATSTWTEGNA